MATCKGAAVDLLSSGRWAQAGGQGRYSEGIDAEPVQETPES